MRNLALFEAYVEYYFAPKHTVGEQLLDVRRDKKERADFAAAEHSDAEDEEEEESDDIDSDLDERYRVEIAEPDGPGGPGEYDA